MWRFARLLPVAPSTRPVWLTSWRRREARMRSGMGLASAGPEGPAVHLSVSRLARTLRVSASMLYFALLAAPAIAQTMPTVEFDEAVRRAIEQNPTVAEATQNIQRAEALSRQTTSFFKPFVSAGITNTTLNSERGFNGLVTQPQNQSAINASVGMPF